MSAVISVEIDAKDALKKLGQMPRQFDEAMDRAIAKIAYLVEGKAKVRTPVDTGRLRASIWTFRERLSATVSTNTNYAVYVHEGTKYMRARPYMLEGLDDARGSFEGIIYDELENALS